MDFNLSFEAQYIIIDWDVHMYAYVRDGEWHMNSEMMQMKFPSSELNFVLVF